jgi:hypothetical protein
MYRPLYQQIDALELEIRTLRSKLDDLSKGTEEKDIKPYSAVGSKRDRSQSRPTDVATGLGQVFTGGVIWNDSEQIISRFGEKPATPTKGYNRHSHSQFSGGALEINSLEIIEYDVDWETNPDYNKDCQSLWRTYPSIKTELNSKNNTIPKVGKLDLVFNADKEMWGCSAYEIDVSKCFFVLRDKNGEIQLDDNGKEMKSPIYITSTIDGVTDVDKHKTSIIWDKTGKCWRVFAVYSDAGIEPAP